MCVFAMHISAHCIRLRARSSAAGHRDPVDGGGTKGPHRCGLRVVGGKGFSRIRSGKSFVGRCSNVVGFSIFMIIVLMDANDPDHGHLQGSLTPLMHAAVTGHRKALLLLLSAKAEADARTEVSTVHVCTQTLEILFVLFCSCFVSFCAIANRAIYGAFLSRPKPYFFRNLCMGSRKVALPCRTPQSMVGLRLSRRCLQRSRPWTLRTRSAHGWLFFDADTCPTCPPVLVSARAA